MPRGSQVWKRGSSRRAATGCAVARVASAVAEVAPPSGACLLDLAVDRPRALAGLGLDLAVAEPAEVQLEDPPATLRQLSERGEHGVELGPSCHVVAAGVS